MQITQIKLLLLLYKSRYNNADMRGKGITVVELLIVIAVIAVLMSILVPISHTAREQTKALVCGSHLKQLSLALTTYAQVNETFPYGFDDSEYYMVWPPPRYPGNIMYDLQGWWWFTSVEGGLMDYTDPKSIFWCPSRNIQDMGPRVNILCGNYGVNQSICKDAPRMINSEFFGTPLALYQIRRPSDTLLITDSGYSLISWKGVTNASVRPFENPAREGSFYVPGISKINKERVILPSQQADAIDGRHLNRTVNVGFVDGHVSRLKADDLLVEEIDGQYNNRSPLWLSE
ncbi:MAG: type II secretion system GspH family protein [Phycisphaerae bacterium]|nr:type II secretion system GspH family protein [Phycisphaerae bacterium]